MGALIQLPCRVASLTFSVGEAVKAGCWPQVGFDGPWSTVTLVPASQLGRTLSHSSSSLGTGPAKGDEPGEKGKVGDDDQRSMIERTYHINTIM